MIADSSVKEKEEGADEHVNLAKRNQKEEQGWEIFQRRNWQN